MERKSAWSILGYVALLGGLVLAANLSANAAPPAPAPTHSVVSSR